MAATAELLDSGAKLPRDSYYVAIVLAALGDKDDAFKALARAGSERSPFLIWLGVDYRWDALRADPRFAELLRDLHLESGDENR